MKTMNCCAPQGTRVRFAYPENGSERDRNKAARFLSVGRVYTVDRTHRFETVTDVWFMEHLGYAFNTLLFEEVPQAPSNGHSTPA